MKQEIPIDETNARCECLGWCWTEFTGTKHHSNCPHYNDSLMDVWKISDGSSWYVSEHKEDVEAEYGEGSMIITQEKMHREVYDKLPEFQGF